MPPPPESNWDDNKHKKFKKKKTKENDAPKDEKHRNLKAFALKSAVKAERQFRRKQDIVAKRERAPQVDRTPIEPPPVVVAIVGPAKVGKSTLIRSLVRNYTRQNLNQIDGPITVVSGKNCRLTFIECNNDINCMIDISKIADLVLLMVDASFGFEMETFEFLNICQSHGFPRIMGVLTHLDVITNPKRLRRTKKQLKHRFWTEIYAGAKLFYLSKFVHNTYLKNEIHNLARFISVMKFRPLQWASSHPYMLVDRIEDITDPELIRRNEKCNRRICMFGYSRGANFKVNQDVHIPGCGDFSLDKISFIPDPCPLPDKEKTTGKRRSLNEKEKRIYAPMAGVGGIVFDKDAIYIDVGGSHSHNQETSAEEELVSSLQQSAEMFDKKIESSEMKLFSDTAPINFNEAEIFEDSRVRRKVRFDDDNDEDDDDDEGEEDEEEDEDMNEEDEDGDSNEEDNDVDNEMNRQNSWKDDLHKKASLAFYKRISRVDNIERLVYDYDDYDKENEQKSNPDDEEDEDELFKVIEKREQSDHKMKLALNSFECTKFPEDLLLDFNSSVTFGFIKDCFVTGKWSKSEDAAALLNSEAQFDDEDDEMANGSESSSLYGDFEDLEDDSGKQSTEGGPSATQDDTANDADAGGEDTLDEIRAKKLRKKEMFDAEYDNLKSADVINPEEKTFLDLEKEKLQKQSEVSIAFLFKFSN